MNSALGLVVACTVAVAQGVAAGEVIANLTVTLDAEEIRDVFLGEKQFSGKVQLIPVDNRALRVEFLAKVLQSDERKYAARWTRKAFREGLAAPVVKNNDAEVNSFVRSTPGAVGYVVTGGEGVRVLERF
jgi:hypothetical protein